MPGVYCSYRSMSLSLSTPRQLLVATFLCPMVVGIRFWGCVYSILFIKNFGGSVLAIAHMFKTLVMHFAVW